jgi:DNA uptake protein ComE-like DNA-binding protein
MENNNPEVSKRNRRAVYVVLALSLFIMFTPRLWTVFSNEPAYELTQTDLIFHKKQFQSVHKHYFKKKKKNRRYSAPVRKFDPNQYTSSDWMLLGLSEKQANAVVKFCKRGIRSAQDLEKIFVMPKELYALVKDSVEINFPKKSAVHWEKEKLDFNRKENSHKLVELNQSTQEELEKVPGIGPFFAKQILKYKSQLGGFYSKLQLLEVWKMDDEKYQKIQKYLFVDPQKVQKMNINQLSVEEFNSHPYLNWNQANSIVKMREQKKGFKQIDEIKQSVLISKELFEKIKPYLVH